MAFPRRSGFPQVELTQHLTHGDGQERVVGVEQSGDAQVGRRQLHLHPVVGIMELEIAGDGVGEIIMAKDIGHPALLRDDQIVVER